MVDGIVRVLEILEKLVEFDSTSRNSNLDIADYIENYLAQHGVRCQRFDYVPGSKTNLYATIGPNDRGGIMLSGHTDVVPVDGQTWSTNPFKLVRRDDRVYGRGTCDMKGFLAVVLAAVPMFVKANLQTPIHLAFSCDEEVGCRGVVPMIEGIVGLGTLPKATIVGEPSSMDVIDAHKGTMTFVTDVTGAEAHSSAPMKGVNAITYAARLIMEMEASAEALRNEGDVTGRFDPPYSTLHIGLISGGTVKNIVPAHCRITWEIRPLPGVDEMPAIHRIETKSEELASEMQKIAPKTSIKTIKLNSVPGLSHQPLNLAEQIALKAAGRNSVSAVSYATEGGLFQAAGIPTVVCGPGSINQAHKPDEYILVGELSRCLTFMASLCALCEAGSLV
ncbi:acetylornithine deacetylase [Mesorhizobium sp. B3-1-3]|uniref:acetylornithine deacetylase n=1 Tax=unclassified Mesorhizobium TaxID=325217 RepID=UPI001129EDD0|nr:MULTISPECIES: acetylornithine deacetylase [unclassified Mesorhizobium]TPI61477.1 acetylornithine deacetylase [Mesorhizobium sp. B3-1-8]TPI70572.1 acetylornithine deacetylase [Mesorhizobium sp. B3-1-3]